MIYKEEEQKNLFEAPHGYYLVHCISGDYTANDNMSHMFDTNYNMTHKLHRNYAIPEGMKSANVGRALLVDDVFNLIIKSRYFHNPTYDFLYDSLVDMREQCEEFEIKKIAMSVWGGGIERLEWEHVKDVIEDVFSETDIELRIYNDEYI